MEYINKKTHAVIPEKVYMSLSEEEKPDYTPYYPGIQHARTGGGGDIALQSIKNMKKND